MSQLRVLILNRTRVRDIAALSKLKNLHLLVLAETEVQDIAPLMTMKALRRLDLFGTLVAAEDIRRLQQALPECYITWDTPLFAKQPEHPR